MGDAGYFRGTSAEQDNRFSDKEKKLMKQMKFADSLATKVDMSRVKLDVIKPWITTRISDYLGMEDDVLVEFVSNQLEADNFPDGRRIQINLTGFLNGKNARLFTGELWDLLVSAQEQSSGIPVAILESKKEEIKLRQEQTEKTLREVQKVQDKLLSDIQKELANPLSEGRNAFQDNITLPSRSSRQAPSYSNYNSFRAGDRDRRPSDRQPERYHRPPNARRTKSRSRSPPAHHSKSGEMGRERERNRGGDRRDRDRARGGDLMDEIRQERDKEKRRQSPVQQRPRRHSPPPPSNQRPSRFHTADLKRELPSHVEEKVKESRSRKKSPSPQPPPSKVARSDSSASSRSASEEENDEPKKKKKKRSRSSEEDSKNSSSKPKKKKKSKKHKKHKKGKKAKKEKERRVTDEEEEDSEESSQEEDEQEDDPPSPRLIDPKRNRDDLERSLRERALESMLKRTTSKE